MNTATNEQRNHALYDRKERAGIYRKYRVQRLGDRAGKHALCDYFVLDWRHDPFALPAAEAYAIACAEKFPDLAADLRKRIEHERARQVGQP